MSKGLPPGISKLGRWLFRERSPRRAIGEIPLPPEELRGPIGPGDFSRVGQDFFDLFVDIGKLCPQERILDVGCGLGRMAVPLSRYVVSGGSYEGFDIVRSSIEWCRQEISTRHPNFVFRHANIHNRFYNPQGVLSAAEYRFPFEDDEFDFAFATSVFTHMLSDEVITYLAELHRVLKPSGRLFATLFLIDETASERIAHCQSGIAFENEWEYGRTEKEDTPEFAIAYNINWMYAQYSASGLSIVEPVHFGEWSGRSDHLSYQDIVIASNKGP